MLWGRWEERESEVVSLEDAGMEEDWVVWREPCMGVSKVGGLLKTRGHQERRSGRQLGQSNVRSAFILSGRKNHRGFDSKYGGQQSFS